MLPGLEILIPADTLPTITIDPTLESAAVPGIVVFVATFPLAHRRTPGRSPWHMTRATDTERSTE